MLLNMNPVFLYYTCVLFFANRCFQAAVCFAFQFNEHEYMCNIIGHTQTNPQNIYSTSEVKLYKKMMPGTAKDTVTHSKNGTLVSSRNKDKFHNF